MLTKKGKRLLIKVGRPRWLTTEESKGYRKTKLQPNSEQKLCKQVKFGQLLEANHACKFLKVQTSEVSSASESENEEDIEKESSPETPKLPAYLPAIQGCRSVEEFHWLNRIEEGTYGVVYRAKDKRTGER